jgi:tellurite resistance protein
MLDNNHWSDEFSPELYLATLKKVAEADGICSEEQAVLDDHADQFGVDLRSLPKVPEELQELSWPTRAIVYRDATMIALADGAISEEEEVYLAELAGRLGISKADAEQISDWIGDYSDVLDRFQEILSR